MDCDSDRRADRKRDARIAYHCLCRVPYCGNVAIRRDIRAELKSSYTTNGILP